ncbi:probable Xaa-Pro aminopeptidase P isoform X2 [Phalaenopsis equestris]|uniref:probable Xaa-Pro aminopeptidase P isoform X2 n=1 Tax=Phalaenopsis equestris TaxID=78828 RepID=UPI0009E53FD3|nr:probable Xaa-Pro aminopeptidase P isoform X2 [Phalaenopsis equestris]
MEASTIATTFPLRPLFLGPHSRSHLSRFRYLGLSIPFSRLFAASVRSRDHRWQFTTRRSGDRITARPSSEFRRKNTGGNGGSEDEKLRSLRELFSRPGIGIDAYIIPSQDAHQSEFIAECFMRRTYLTGFDGSAGTAVVTKDMAALWTDGRYFLQAEKQLGRDWTLMRSGNLGVPTITEWLNESLPPGCKIGVDPFLFSYDTAEEMKEAVSNKNHELVFLYDYNLVDEIWGELRPKPPCKPIIVHDIKYAGVDISSKLSTLRSELAEASCTAVVISMLDEVAWLLNLRGNDVSHAPVFYSYLVVSNTGATLFVDNKKVTEEVMGHLSKAGVQLSPYEAILSEIESLAGQGAKLLFDSSTVNAAIVSIFNSASNRHFHRPENKVKGKIGQETRLESTKQDKMAQIIGQNTLFKISPISLAKALKNDAEIKGMRNAHLRDAAALAEFWAWLEDGVQKNLNLTEVEVSQKLLEFRRKQFGFIGTSFETITGYGANGAIIHYRPNPASCSVVGDKNIFLLDSGGQYVDGTTDITRTVHFGDPTGRQKECFTRVLQGHIALDQAIFPERTPGFVLDVLARSSLWKIGLDYRHGTGHGVGAALNVHEGPQSISFRYTNMNALQVGMIVSNEPGYYEDHSFGIRIENLLHVREENVPNNFGGIRYFGFERLTFVPIQSKLVDCSLLSLVETKWYNDYHSEIWEKVSPLVQGAAQEWLWRNTRPLSLPQQIYRHTRSFPKQCARSHPQKCPKTLSKLYMKLLE